MLSDSENDKDKDKYKYKYKELAEAELKALLKELDDLQQMKESMSPRAVGKGTTTSTDISQKNLSTPRKDDRSRRFALPAKEKVTTPTIPVVSKSLPATTDTASTTTMTTTTTSTATLASTASGASSVSRPVMPSGHLAIASMDPKTSPPTPRDHIRAASNDAIERALRSFDELLASLVNKLAGNASYLESRRDFKEKAAESNKALTPEAAKELAAGFWVDVIWQMSPPLIEPRRKTGKAIRSQLVSILIRILKSTKLSGITLTNCAPIISFIEWSRDGRIGWSDPDRYEYFLDGPVRLEVAKGLTKYVTSDQEKRLPFGESGFVQLTPASTVAFWPFVSHLVKKFDGLLCDKDSREDNLSPADAARYRYWMLTLPTFFENADKTQLRLLVGMMAEEVLKALPDGSAQFGVLHSQRKFLLVRCLHVAFMRGSAVLGLQRSQLIQRRNYGLGGLFCVSLVMRLFKAAVLIAVKEDPSGTLMEIVRVEPFDETMANASGAAKAIALEIGELVNEALDAAKTPQR